MMCWTVRRGRADTRPAAVSTPDNNTIRHAAAGGVDSGEGCWHPHQWSETASSVFSNGRSGPLLRTGQPGAKSACVCCVCLAWQALSVAHNDTRGYDEVKPHCSPHPVFWESFGLNCKKKNATGLWRFLERACFILSVLMNPRITQHLQIKKWRSDCLFCHFF